jgi:cytochrome c oxidase cbb3-type subunit 2
VYNFVRYSLSVAAGLCIAAFVAGRALGQIPKAEASSYDPAKGQALYAANCSACHQAAGVGLPGAFPPLKGSNVVNKDDATKHIRIVLDGDQGGKVGGVTYASAMPPFAGVLRDADIVDIINYERSSWGNHGKPVTAEQVAAERGNSKVNK